MIKDSLFGLLPEAMVGALNSRCLSSHRPGCFGGPGGINLSEIFSVKKPSATDIHSYLFASDQMEYEWSMDDEVRSR